jgi:hypothetical protein
MTETEKERKRIADIIRNCIDVIHNTINICAKNKFRVAGVFFDATNELYLLLREIEEGQSK